MPKTVLQYPLDFRELQSIKVPRGAQPLTVQDYNGIKTLWALVDPVATLEERKIAIVGTGSPAPDDGSIYLGTFQTDYCVWHYFMEP